MNQTCERDVLLRELPSPWLKDPLAIPALRLAAPPGAYARVTDDDVFIAYDVLGHEVIRLPLLDFTIGEVIAQCAAVGFDLRKIDPPPADAMSGMLLLPSGSLPGVKEGAHWNVSKWNQSKWVLRATARPVIYRWTSPTWRLLNPLATALGQETANTLVGLTQLNLLTSAAFFADLWGSYLGIPRKTNEDDATYTARVRHEILRPRENNQALAQILEEDFPPIHVEVVDDLVRHCFMPSDDIQLRYRPLRGWRYNIATIEIVVRGGFPTIEMIRAAERHSAGGVKVYMRGEWFLDLMPSPAGYDFAGTQVLVGRPLPIKINAPPPVGTGKIGPP